MGVMYVRRRIMLNEPHIVTTTQAGVANFSTDLIAPLKSCKVEFSPVQSGSGDPSPTNIRPITGWTGLTAYRTGKNLFDKNKITDKAYLNTTTGAVISAGPYCVTDYIPVFKNVPIYIPASNTVRRWFYDAHKNAKTYLNNSQNQVFIPTENGYIRVSIYTDIYNSYQIEYGSIATTYEPYSGTTLPIDWTTEAGTVYGGYVDLATGELVATWALANFNNASRWNSYGTGDAFFVYHIESSMMNTNYAAGVCDRFPTKTSASQSISIPYIRIGGGNDNGIYFYNVTQLNVTSVSEWKEYIGTTGVNVVYPLATPITYQLTPTQLKSLRGTNNIWSNTNGNVTVKHWKH